MKNFHLSPKGMLLLSAFAVLAGCQPYTAPDTSDRATVSSGPEENFFLEATASPTPEATETPDVSSTPTPTSEPLDSTTETPATPVPTTISAKTSTPAPAQKAITVQGFAFEPGNITVKIGTKVTWTNKDAVTHTVTSDTGVFDSGDLPTDQSFSYTFTEVGSFPYHCTPHPKMTGTVVVTP